MPQGYVVIVMTVIEFYEKIGGDYKEVTNRLMKESRLRIYLMQFEAEDSFAEFIEKLDAEEYEDAFRAVHNIKGLALNLGLTPLIEVVSTLCELLRKGKPEIDISDKVEELRQAYKLVTDNILRLNE